MSKRVDSGLPISTDCPPTPPPAINSTVKKVTAPILSRHPTTTPPLIAATSPKGPPQREAFCFKVPLNDNLRPKKPLNISEVQDYMQKGDQADEIPIAIALYFQAICAIETSQINIKGLLLKAICYLKSAKLQLGVNNDLSNDIKQAKLSLEAVLELFVTSNNEANHCKFIYLIGSACLALYAYSNEEPFLNKAKIFFSKAARLLERESSNSHSSLKHQDPLRHTISFGLALSHFYQAKHIISNQGSAKIEPLLQHLQASRSCLIQAIALQEGDHLSYMLALNDALTACLIDEETEKKVNSLIIGSLNQKSLQHLNTAIKILNAIAKKNRDALILLGILKYSLAFSSNDNGRAEINLFAAMDAENHLSHAYKMALIEDPSLILCLGDCARQLAWLTQSEFYQSRAKAFVEKASVEGFIGDTLLRVFYIQNALFKLIEMSSKMQDVDKEAMTNLCENLFLLKSILKKKSENTLSTALKEQVDLLEQAHHHLTISSTDEAKRYAQNALSIGDSLNQLYAPVLFQKALLERLRVFDLGLELEQDF